MEWVALHARGKPMNIEWDPSQQEEFAKEEQRMLAEYSERFQPRAYSQVFYPPKSGEWKVDADFPDGFFESAKVILEGITGRSLHEGIEGVAAVFLCRHYLELALKYTLYHSRWLNDETHNAGDDVEPVCHGHDLQKWWDKLNAELRRRVPSILATGFDLDFVAEFVKEFQEVDKHNTRFRYPGKQLPVVPPTHGTLHIDFETLLLTLKRVHDILDTLDMHLIERHGENEEWQAYLDSV
jgi:hypothetical protein